MPFEAPLYRQCTFEVHEFHGAEIGAGEGFGHNVKTDGVFVIGAHRETGPVHRDALTHFEFRKFLRSGNREPRLGPAQDLCRAFNDARKHAGILAEIFQKRQIFHRNLLFPEKFATIRYEIIVGIHRE